MGRIRRERDHVALAIAVLAPLSALYHARLRGTWRPLGELVPPLGLDTASCTGTPHGPPDVKAAALFHSLAETVFGQSCFMLLLVLAVCIATGHSLRVRRATSRMLRIALCSVLVSSATFSALVLTAVTALRTMPP